MYKQIILERPGKTAGRYQQVTAARGEMRCHPLLWLGRQIREKLQILLAAYKERLRIQRDIEILRQMSGHQLRDIGLERLPGGHFGPISPDRPGEQPAKIRGQRKSEFPDFNHGRKRGVARR